MRTIIGRGVCGGVAFGKLELMKKNIKAYTKSSYQGFR